MRNIWLDKNSRPLGIWRGYNQNTVLIKVFLYVIQKQPLITDMLDYISGDNNIKFSFNVKNLHIPKANTRIVGMISSATVKVEIFLQNINGVR